MNNYLCHSGTHGMKWYKRRYQNPDGTLTEEGKLRYAKRREMRKRALGAKKDEKSNVQKIAGSSEKAVESVKNINKTLNSQKTRDAEKKAYDKQTREMKKMTDAQLRAKVNRLNLEKQYRQLSKKDIEVGHNKIRDYISIAGDVVAVGASAAAIATSIYSIKHG